TACASETAPLARGCAELVEPLARLGHSRFERLLTAPVFVAQTAAAASGAAALTGKRLFAGCLRRFGIAQRFLGLLQLVLPCFSFRPLPLLLLELLRVRRPNWLNAGALGRGFESLDAHRSVDRLSAVDDAAVGHGGLVDRLGPARCG